jgi:hypothetical protein
MEKLLRKKHKDTNGELSDVNNIEDFKLALYKYQHRSIIFKHNHNNKVQYPPCILETLKLLS